MLEEALSRSFRAVPPRDLNDIRLPKTTVLYCTRSACPRCRTFDGERRTEYERTKYRGVRVLRWDCDDPTLRALALRAGVDVIPAYIEIPTHAQGTFRVVNPE